MTYNVIMESAERKASTFLRRLVSAKCPERGCDPLRVLQSEHARRQVQRVAVLGDICRPLPSRGFCHFTFRKNCRFRKKIVPSANLGARGTAVRLPSITKRAPGPGRMFAARSREDWVPAGTIACAERLRYTRTHHGDFQCEARPLRSLSQPPHCLRPRRRRRNRTVPSRRLHHRRRIGTARRASAMSRLVPTKRPEIGR